MHLLARMMRLAAAPETQVRASMEPDRRVCVHKIGIYLTRRRY
jgi:hypothetical protein